VVRKAILTVLVTALLELILLVEVTTRIGLWPVLATSLGMAALGVLIARRQGLKTVRRVQGDLLMGRPPAPRLIDQTLVIFGAILLIVPGFLTSLLGLALLFPPTRALIKLGSGRFLAGRIRVHLQGSTPKGGASPETDTPQGRDLSDDADYTVIIP